MCEELGPAGVPGMWGTVQGGTGGQAGVGWGMLNSPGAQPLTFFNYHPKVAFSARLCLAARPQCQPISYPLPLLYFSLLSTYHSLMFYVFHTGKTAGDFILVVHNSIPRLGRVVAEQIFAECMTADFRPQSPFLLFKRQGIYVSE